MQREFDINQYTSTNNYPTDTGDRLNKCYSCTCPVGRFHLSCHAAEGVAEAQDWFCSENQEPISTAGARRIKEAEW